MSSNRFVSEKQSTVPQRMVRSSVPRRNREDGKPPPSPVLELSMTGSSPSSRPLPLPQVGTLGSRYPDGFTVPCRLTLGDEAPTLRVVEKSKGCPLDPRRTLAQTGVSPTLTTRTNLQPFNSGTTLEISVFVTLYTK